MMSTGYLKNFLSKYQMKSFHRYLQEDFEPTTRFHTELNPVLWTPDERLKPEIRSKLLAFAETWATFAHIPPNLIEDILLVGGSAGYNYTSKSDLDVHLLLDRNKLGDRKLVDELLQTKKSLWGLQHHVTVAGLAVEGYAQDRSESSPKSQGIYSLKDDRWLKKPELPPILDTKSPAFKAKVQSFMSRIDTLISSNAPLEKFKILKDRLKDMRSAGLARGGEFAQENLIFKNLRDLGYLDKMTNYIKDKEDKDLSL